MGGGEMEREKGRNEKNERAGEVPSDDSSDDRPAEYDLHEDHEHGVRALFIHSQ